MYAESRIVLEQLLGLTQRQGGLENRMDDTERDIRAIARGTPRGNPDP